MKRQAPRHHSLLMLGRGSFAGLWNEHFPNVAELRNAVVGTDLPAFLQGRPTRFQPHIERFTRIVQELHVERLSYRQLADQLRGGCTRQTMTHHPEPRLSAS